MSRLELSGVLSAVNAFAIHDNGHFAYLFDPRVNATIRIDIRNGTRDVLRWYDHSFYHPRWLCYCMFTMHRDSTTYLPTLFFNKKRKLFVLVTFSIDQNKKVLHKLQENSIAVDPVRPERLAYNAHKDDHKLHIIFYDRFTRHYDQIDDQSSSLAFVYCSFNCQTLRLSTRKGFLPPGQWELPFTAHEGIHFISTERTTTQLATVPTEMEETTYSWNIRPVSPDNNDSHPPRKAVWCNAWRNGMAWYVLCEKNIVDLQISRTITLWQLDVLDCRWRKLPIDIPAPVTAANFAVRVDVNEIAYLHCDWERDAVFHQFNLNELLLQRQDIPLATIEEETEDEDELSPVTPCSNPEFLSLSSAEIICPICMDTYDDPRTLSCGHSICNNCVEHMKATAKNNTIRCFACRKATTIPAAGLPVNFGLKDAIETLEKARQLSLSNLRCGRCRTQCDECDMWICLKCCQERAVLETSFPTKTEELPDGADEKDDAATALTKRYSFCASCILKHHSNHRVDELSTFRERWKYAKEKNSKCSERIAAILKNLRASFVKQIEPALMQPLRFEVSSDLSEACDPVANNTSTISSEADQALLKFESRVTNLIENMATNFQIILKQSLDASSPRNDRPTQI